MNQTPSVPSQPGGPVTLPPSPSLEGLTDSQRQELRKIIHDLNGELFLIRGYAELTIEHVADNAIATRNLRKTLDRAATIESLVLRLRAFLPQS